MANRQRAEARRKAQAKAARQGGGGSLKFFWIGLVTVLAVVAVVVIVANSGDDGGDASSTSTGDTSLNGLPDSQPVTVTGDALPTLSVEFSNWPDDEEIGTTAPVLAGKDFQGDDIVIDAAATGKPYMIVFLAHWCPHCNREVPRLLDWRKTGGIPDDLQIVGVATAASPSSANYPPAQWFSDKGWSWPVMVDESNGDHNAGKAAITMGAPGWPYIVIIGADGTVKGRVSGELSLDDIQSFVDTALAS